MACTERGIAVAEGVGSPVAPAELTWALVMASMRRLPQYIANLKHGAWQQSGLKAAYARKLLVSAAFCAVKHWGSGAMAVLVSWWRAMAAHLA